MPRKGDCFKLKTKRRPKKAADGCSAEHYSYRSQYLMKTLTHPRRWIFHGGVIALNKINYPKMRLILTTVNTITDILVIKGVGL